MVLSGLETALLGGMIATGAGFGGVFLKGWLNGSQCEKCGIDGLRAEIKTQSRLIRMLAEKAGITVKEQLEIEQAMHNQE